MTNFRDKDYFALYTLSEKLDSITDFIKEAGGRCRVQELSAKFGKEPQTMRNYLRALEAKGTIKCEVVGRHYLYVLVGSKPK